MSKITQTDLDDLIKAFMVLKTRDEIESFLIDLTTPSELKALSERFKVATLLDRGDLSYRALAQMTGASTTTITRVARYLKDMPHQGYRLALDRQKAISIHNETPTEKTKK
jgi:TrpR-related protein YerC/YecD